MHAFHTNFSIKTPEFLILLSVSACPSYCLLLIAIQRCCVSSGSRVTADRYRPSTAYNQSGVSYHASDANANMTNFQQVSVIDQATSISGYRSRFLPRVSPRALNPDPPRQPGAGSPGRCEWDPYVTWSLIVPSAKMVRVSTDKLKHDKIVDGRDNSTHTTDDAVSFRAQPTGLMRTQDDWCRMIEASPGPRAWLGAAWLIS